jgi:O-antigen/teichoic acid export membrane protein
MALGVANFGAPLAAAQFTREIGPLVGALVLARALAWLGYRQLAHAAIGTPRGTAVGPAARGLAGHEMRALLAAGGWFTVSAVVSPLLVQADRFFIGARLSAAAVPSYTVPFDIITQLLVFVTAVSTVAFPSIAAQRATDAAAAHAVFVRWRRRVGGGMALICAGVAWALPAALERWVGGTLASAALADAVVVGRWLCLGVWLNALGAMQLAWMHGHGRFRATALLHLAELGPYLLALWLLLPVCGVAGAAMAWVGRVAIDTLMLSWLARSRLAGAPR